MLQSSFQRKLSWLKIAADETALEKKGISKRSMLARTLLQRRKPRLVVLMSACLLLVVTYFSLRHKSFVMLCTIITRFLEGRCKSEDIALWRGTHLKQNFPKLDTTAKVDLVVSHCDLPINWIFEWAAPIEFNNISIFSKCGKPVVGAPDHAKIIRLENVGRCDHTYAYFMSNYHSETSSEGSGTKSDFVVFFKDNDNSHRNHYSRHKKLDEMIPLAKEFGFACHEETNWVWSKGTPMQPICEISYFHDWSGLGEFKVESYSRLRRDDNSEFQSRTGATLGEYANNMSIKPQTSSSSRMHETLARDMHAIVPVCYGGNFMAQSEQILSHSSAFWQRIESSLSRGNNIAEGHFMERLWGTILAKPLHRDIVTRVWGQTRYGVCGVEKNHLGALSK